MSFIRLLLFFAFVSDEGSGIDPHGASAQDHGWGIDPNGLSSDRGLGMDPNG